MHDHFHVISWVGKRQVGRLVIALNCEDAADTHREHYPENPVIQVFAKGRRR